MAQGKFVASDRVSPERSGRWVYFRFAPISLDPRGTPARASKKAAKQESEPKRRQACAVDRRALGLTRKNARPWPHAEERSDVNQQRPLTRGGRKDRYYPYRANCLDARRPWHERSPGGLWAERTDRTAGRDWSWYGWAPRPGVLARPSPVIAPSGPAGGGHYRPD